MTAPRPETRPHYDRLGYFHHPCEVPGCTRDGTFGFGVWVSAGRLGRWYCAAHRSIGENTPDVETAETPPRPAPASPARQGRLL